MLLLGSGGARLLSGGRRVLLQGRLLPGRGGYVLARFLLAGSLRRGFRLKFQLLSAGETVCLRVEEPLEYVTQ